MVGEKNINEGYMRYMAESKSCCGVPRGRESEREEGKMRNILLKPEIIHHDGITDPSKLLFTLNFS